eukprot:XP_001699823.1 predicted protein [Chlamydomonas reinhardtii]
MALRRAWPCQAPGARLLLGCVALLCLAVAVPAVDELQSGIIVNQNCSTVDSAVTAALQGLTDEASVWHLGSGCSRLEENFVCSPINRSIAIEGAPDGCSVWDTEFDLYQFSAEPGVTVTIRNLTLARALVFTVGYGNMQPSLLHMRPGSRLVLQNVVPLANSSTPQPQPQAFVVPSLAVGGLVMENVTFTCDAGTSLPTNSDLVVHGAAMLSSFVAATSSLTLPATIHLAENITLPGIAAPYNPDAPDARVGVITADTTIESMDDATGGAPSSELLFIDANHTAAWMFVQPPARLTLRRLVPTRLRTNIWSPGVMDGVLAGATPLFMVSYWCVMVGIMVPELTWAADFLRSLVWQSDCDVLGRDAVFFRRVRTTATSYTRVRLTSVAPPGVPSDPADAPPPPGASAYPHVTPPLHFASTVAELAEAMAPLQPQDYLASPPPASAGGRTSNACDEGLSELPTTTRSLASDHSSGFVSLEAGSSVMTDTLQSGVGGVVPGLLDPPTQEGPATTGSGGVRVGSRQLVAGLGGSSAGGSGDASVGVMVGGATPRSSSSGLGSGSRPSAAEQLPAAPKSTGAICSPGMAVKTGKRASDTSGGGGSATGLLPVPQPALLMSPADSGMLGPGSSGGSGRHHAGGAASAGAGRVARPFIDVDGSSPGYSAPMGNVGPMSAATAAAMALSAGGTGAGMGMSSAEPASEVARLISELAGHTAEQLVILEPIGQGGYGTVYKGLWRNLDVAVKTVLFQDRQANVTTPAGTPGLGSQSTLLCSHTQPHSRTCTTRARSTAARRTTRHGGLQVADAQAASRAAMAAGGGVTDWKLYLVQEFCDAGSLASALDRRLFHDATTMPNLALTLCVLADIARGMAHIHTRSILRADLGVGLVAKVADFGLCVWTQGMLAPGKRHISNALRGTPFYTSPETVATGTLTKASDVYSFGVIAWEVYTGRPPFTHSPERGFVRDDVFPRLPPHVPPTFANLTLACLSADPDQRPTFDQILDRIVQLQSKLAQSLQQRLSRLVASHGAQPGLGPSALVAAASASGGPGSFGASGAGGSGLMAPAGAMSPGGGSAITPGSAAGLLAGGGPVGMGGSGQYTPLFGPSIYTGANGGVVGGGAWMTTTSGFGGGGGGGLMGGTGTGTSGLGGGSGGGNLGMGLAGFPTYSANAGMLGVPTVFPHVHQHQQQYQKHPHQQAASAGNAMFGAAGGSGVLGGMSAVQAAPLSGSAAASPALAATGGAGVKGHNGGPQAGTAAGRP